MRTFAMDTPVLQRGNAHPRICVERQTGCGPQFSCFGSEMYWYDVALGQQFSMGVCSRWSSAPSFLNHSAVCFMSVAGNHRTPRSQLLFACGCKPDPFTAHIALH
eukprot:EG_transcript_48620